MSSFIISIPLRWSSFVPHQCARRPPSNTVKNDACAQAPVRFPIANIVGGVSEFSEPNGDRNATPDQDQVRTLLQSDKKGDQQRGLLLVKQLPPDIALELLIFSIKTSNNDFIRSTATISIGDIDMSNPGIRKTAVSLLSELLSTADDYSVRSAAAAAIGYISDIEKPLLSSLVETLSHALIEDTEWQVHFSCLAALGNLRDPVAVPTLVQYLSHENSLLVQAAIGALGDLAAQNAVPSLLQLLGSKDMMTRQRLAQALSRMPDGAAEPALIDALRTLSKDQSFAVREAAVDGLKMFGFPEPAKVEQQSDEELIDKEVANLLEGDETGNASESASDALRRRLERSFNKEYVDVQWRKHSSGAINNISEHSAESQSAGVPFNASDDQDSSINEDKNETSNETNTISERTGFVVERYDKLVKDLKEGNRHMQVMAAIELRKFDPKLALNAVVESKSLDFTSTSERLRSVCIALLARAGAINSIIDVLNSDPDQNVRSACCDALLDFNDEQIAIDACIQAFKKDPHWLVRISAAITLGTIGKGNEATEKTLISSLSPGGVENMEYPQDSVVQRHAITALGFLGSQKSLGAFTEIISAADTETPIRYRIAAALSGIPCKDSVTLARRLVDDEDDEVAQMAQGSLDSLAQQGFS